MGTAPTSQKGVVLAQEPLYKLGYMDIPSHKEPKESPLHELAQG